MYCKIVWCYVFVLTLLDISLNTKLTAQGKSHGVTVHDSLIEGITIQEWGKESGGEGGARRAAGEALALSPPALHFGRAPLAAAHALSVTLTNTANTTMHLASVAGTTPDFHASFFESKTLPPEANTTFSVVYLGRREGPVSAHLYIHTSLGVHKYPVSAVGVASEWGVWPLVGLRVPANASAEPLLTLSNPTEHSVQVSEVYSSAAWLGLRLPDGAATAPRAAWLLPPRARRALVRLRAAPPPHHHARAAYVRIKGTLAGGAALSLVVCVEARQVPAGEFLAPWQLRLRARGHADPPLVMDIEAGNSLDSAVSLDASVWAAQCAAEPVAPPAPPDPTPPAAPGAPAASSLDAPAAANGQLDRGTANGNGVKSDGVHVSLLRTHLPPHQELTRAAQLTLDYAAMWASYAAGGGGAGAGAEGEAWCAGWLRVGRAALPYSLRLLRGTLRAEPPQLHFVTANREEALKQREIRVHNEFSMPVYISHIERGTDIDEHFECEWLAPLQVAAGGSAVVARLRLRGAPPALALNASLVLHTNVTAYVVPVYVYSGELHLEWEWPNSADGELRLGAVGASSTRRVALRARNPAPAPLCVVELRADLPGAQLVLHACAHLRHVPDAHACRCIEAGAEALAWLTVVAPAREGALRGGVQLAARAPGAGAGAPAAHSRAAVSLHAHPGRLHALPVLLPRVAPYVPASAPLVLESSMALRMRVLRAAPPTPEPDPALSYLLPEEGELGVGRHEAGTVQYAAERLCEPRCYTGLDISTPEGLAWVRRSEEPSAESLEQDAALHAERYAEFTRHAQRARNVSLYLHTTQVVQIPVVGVVSWWWARLAEGAGSGGVGSAGLGGVGGARAWRLRARNPAARPLLLQPVLAGPLRTPLPGSTEAPLCATEACTWSPESFRLEEWRATRGDVRTWPDASPDSSPDSPPDPSQDSSPDPTTHPSHNASRRPLPTLLLAPGAEVELKLVFAPKEALALSAFLYLRNNLTIIEPVQLSGRGVHPTFELGGRKPNTHSPFLFDVHECLSERGVVRRRVVARNTGRVTLRLRDWRVAGAPCQARGFRMQPCAPVELAPNESRVLHVAFSPDYLLARVSAALQLRTDTGRATYILTAMTSAKYLGRCSAALPRPTWEPPLRAGGALAALVALALVLAGAALDAERELRLARAARPPPAPRRPLDLREIGRAAPAPPPAPAAAPAPRRAPPAPGRRRRTRPRPEPDAHAERRAFDCWRAEMLRRADDDDERSSEDAECEPEPEPEPAPPAADEYDADPETEDRPHGSGDEDAASTGSGTASASTSSTPTADEHDADADEPEPLDALEPAEPREPADAPPASRSASAAGARAARPRHGGDTTRRPERARVEDGTCRARSAVAKAHARKDKPSKRRERPPDEPPRSPPRAHDGRAGGALRWGASWSSVVARGGAAPGTTPGAPGAGAGGGVGVAPLAPIGSDVRRRAEPPGAGAGVAGPGAGGGDHSLFYFNGDAAHARAEFAWRAPPALERPAFVPPRDYLEEPGVVGSGAFRSASAAWGAALGPRPTPAAAAWLWGAAGAGGPGAGAAPEVRPPPGFGAPARPARVYDPFRSLAAIWAPGARDWGAEQNERRN